MIKFGIPMELSDRKKISSAFEKDAEEYSAFIKDAENKNKKAAEEEKSKEKKDVDRRT